MSDKTIAVVGGAYGEECSFPRTNMLRGSGGRAAAFLGNLHQNVEFHTKLGDKLKEQFESISRTIGYSLKIRSREQDIWFRYKHPVGKPSIYFPQSETKTANEHSWEITCTHALVFGMLDGRAVTKAKRVVYDPQDGSNAKPYDFNGSTAEELAIVLSHSEGVALTGHRTPDKIASKLLNQSKNISVVILKCGPQGALVKTAQSYEWVRPFPTEKVYKIGSGDIYSAAFAHAWLMELNDPFEAAWFASRVTAEYVQTTIDRIPSARCDVLLKEAIEARNKLKSSAPADIPKSQIYLAGPFFNTSQQWLIDEARDSLEDMGFRVFSPIHEVGTGDPEYIASKDLKGLEESGIILAILDGLDPGTIFEIGYARAKGIPVVVIAEDIKESDLTMLIGTKCKITSDFATGIYAVCWHLMKDV